MSPLKARAISGEIELFETKAKSCDYQHDDRQKFGYKKDLQEVLGKARIFLITSFG